MAATAARRLLRLSAYGAAGTAAAAAAVAAAESTLEPVRPMGAFLRLCKAEPPKQDDAGALAAADVAPSERSRILVLGSGWAAQAFVRDVDTQKFDVCMVSPVNYFLFTPLLPSTTVGTTEVRSIVESNRVIVGFRNHSLSARLSYALRVRTPREVACVEGTALNVDAANKRVRCRTSRGDEFDLEYDKLIVAVGSQCNTFGTPGVYENAHFLKSVKDATAIRAALIDSLESASCSTDEAEKKRLTSTVVVGGGPTGVEFAGELVDYIHSDLAKLYDDARDARVTLVQSADHILNTYDKKISEYAEQTLSNANVDVVTNSRVLEVKEGSVVVKDKKSGNVREVPYGVCVWSTGVASIPLTKALMEQASGTAQAKARALRVDSGLQALGLKDVWAVGDAAAVDNPKLRAALKDLFKEADDDNSGYLDTGEYDKCIRIAMERFPQSAEHLRKVRRGFDEADTDHDGKLSMAEMDAVLTSVDKKTRAYPATAQVAAQQGTWLAKRFNSDNVSDGFVYKHKGELCYLGQEKAAAGLASASGDEVVLVGEVVSALWHGAYFNMMRDERMKLKVGFDWAKARLFGRDTSRC